jgi:hypothetical protein
MPIGDLLRERQDTIVERWAESLFSSYPSDAAVLFQKQQDPFANPIGKSVREGTRGLFQAILDGMDPAELRSHLDGIIRVRAVQQFSPSEALSFVFSLRSILRKVVPELDTDPKLRKEAIELDETIDRVALAAFDVYTDTREQLAQLRINETKRQMGWVLEKMNQSEETASDPPDAPGRGPPSTETVQREDLR